MSRTITRPAQEIREEIRSIEEVVTEQGATGFVRVLVGTIDADGRFIVPQQYVLYQIGGEMYDELVGPPQSWNPTKPDGTYHNDDLWHFIDILRNPPPVTTEPDKTPPVSDLTHLLVAP